jgi:beta-lactamase regulating signal transducer with metallopeptidase domain
MQPVFQSSFLLALGFAIANSLWQMALIWLVYMCVNSLVSFTASTKYRFAVAAQFTGFVWFLITLQFYYSQYTEALQHSPVVSAGVQNILSAQTDLSSRLINGMLKAEQFLPYISMAYLLLMVFLSIRLLFGYRQTQMIRKTGLQKIPADWRLFVKRIAAQLGIKKEIRLFLSDTVTTPLTIGFFKPIILIPVASINHLTTDQLEAILLHELAHIKRYDYLLNIILSVVELALFFNPFTQLLSKRIREERENSCDDWVLQFKYNATVYAEALLRIAYLQSAPAFAMAASGRKNDLLIRVKRMIDKKDNRFSYRKQLLAFFIVTGMLSSIAWLNPIASPYKQTTRTGQKINTAQKVQSYAVEPMAVSVDNPLFNPMFFLSKPLKAEMKKNIASAQKEIDLANKETKNLATDLVESIPPMVANALEQASAVLTDKKQTEWEKQISSMEFAKASFEKAFHNDSMIKALPQKMRAPFAKDMAQSMKEVTEEIRKAKLEMEGQWKENKLMNIDKEKVEKEIKKAMEEVSRMDLGKLVVSALDIPGLVFMDEKENSQPRKIKVSTHALPKGADNLRKMKRGDPAETEASFPDRQKTETDNIEFDVPAVMVPDAPPANREQLRIDAAKLLRLKQLFLKEAARKQIKAVPVTYLFNGEKEAKLVIVLQ